MSTTIKYTTDLSSELTESQLSLVNTYNKEISENGVLKKVEVYENGILSSNQYYLTSPYEITAILLEDSNAYMVTNETINGHSIETSLRYKNSELVRKTVCVKNMEGHIICLADYEILTDSPNYSKTFKTLFDEEGEELYEFDYNEIGLCIHIHNLQEVQADIFPADIGVDPDLEFTWAGNEYYQFAYPIIPEN
jgi:hypothetical protein